MRQADVNERDAPDPARSAYTVTAAGVAKYASTFDPMASVGFGSRPAVVIVDVQQYITNPESATYCEAAAATLGAIRRLATTARAKGFPVIYVTQVLDPVHGAAQVEILSRKLKAYHVFFRGSRWARIAGQIAPEEGDVVVEKTMASGFFQTSLARLLTARRVDTLIFCGFAVSGCLRATVVDAMYHGFIPIVVDECASDRNPVARTQNLFDIGLRYCDVRPLEYVLERFEKLSPTVASAATQRT